MIATKKGISLKLHNVKILSNLIEDITESLGNNVERKWHLGNNIYVSIREDNPCVDIRQYWRPPEKEDSVPTKKDLCF